MQGECVLKVGEGGTDGRWHGQALQSHGSVFGKNDPSGWKCDRTITVERIRRLCETVYDKKRKKEGKTE